MIRYWFTSVWEHKELFKKARPSYLIGLLNLLVPSLFMALASVLLVGVDYSAYLPAVIVSFIRYTIGAFGYAFVLVASKKGSLQKMFYLVSFPITGYLLSVNTILLLTNYIPNLPATMLIRGVLVLLVIAGTQLAKEETGTKYWKAGLWLIIALALGEFIAGNLAPVITSWF